MPELGSKVKLKAGSGLGEAAVDSPLSAEMLDLDMPAGATAEVVAVDDERDLIILAWRDASDNPRRTSVTPADFRSRFTKAGKS